MSGIRRADLLYLAILTSLITLLFIDVIAGYHSLFLRDVAHYYYPVKHALREIVLGGEFPYWNPLMAAGQPMAANPEHEVFYPLTWLILLPSYDLGFRALVLLHLYISGWTMYAFLRSLPLAPAASFLAALSFAIGGIVLSNLAILPILFVLAWLPLTCLFARRFLLERRPRDFAGAALSLGLQMLVAEPVSILMTAMIVGSYALSVSLRRRNIRPLALGLLIGVSGLAVGAVAILPAADHAADSVRAEGFDYETVTTWSMPVARVAELVFPNILGHHDADGANLYWGAPLYGRQRTPFYLSIYAGLLLATTCVAGLFLRARGAVLTSAIVGVSVLLAAGDHTPLWRLLYDAGVARSVRYPEKFILIAVFAATVFGARVLDRVLAGDERARRGTLTAAMGIAGIAAMMALIALTPWSAQLFIALWHPTQDAVTEILPRWRSAWIVTALFATLLALLLRNVPRIARRTWVALATLFIVLDLGLLLPELAPRVPSEYLTEPPPLALQLPEERESWRLMHVIEWQKDDVSFRPFTSGSDLYWIGRNALRPAMPARWGIRTVMEADYDMTTLQPTNDFVGLAWWLALGRPDWPAVIAPMANARFLGSYDDPRSALARVEHDRRAVQPVRITPLGDHPRYFFAEQVESYRDENELALRLATIGSTKNMAFVKGSAFQPAGGTVLGVRETANTARIEVESEGRAFLVVSVTPHKYWRVTIDGVAASTVVTNVGFQGVVVPGAGRHVIEMRYRNPLIAVGGAISLAALLALAWVAVRMRAL